MAYDAAVGPSSQSDSADPIPAGNAGETRWAACPATDLSWAELGGDHAVYHRPSGKTHFVNTPTVLLLSEILVMPRTTHAAAQALAVAQRHTCDHRFVVAVEDLLGRLGDLGLVHCVP